MKSILHSYVGKNKNPFDQFVQMNRATTELPEIINNDPESGRQFIQYLTSDGKFTASKFIAYYRVLSILNQLNQEEWGDALRDQLFKLRKNGFWIEWDKDIQSEVENTIFHPQPSQFSEDAYSEKLGFIANNRVVGHAEKALNRIFAMLESKNGQHNSLFQRLTYDLDRTPFDALVDVHYEASSNASNHALAGLANHNTDLAPFGFLGDIQYLQFNALRENIFNQRHGSPWPEEYFEFLDSHRSVREREGIRFLSVSYVDNGPGIIPHLEMFAPSKINRTTSIQKIILEHISENNDVRAGEGLGNIKDAVQDADACLLIYSASEGYFFNGVSEAEKLLPGISKRGTMINIILPV